MFIARPVPFDMGPPGGRRAWAFCVRFVDEIFLAERMAALSAACCPDLETALGSGEAVELGVRHSSLDGLRPANVSAVASTGERICVGSTCVNTFW